MTRLSSVHVYRSRFCNQPAFFRVLQGVEAGFKTDADRTEQTPELEPVGLPEKEAEPVPA